MDKGTNGYFFHALRWIGQHYHWANALVSAMVATGRTFSMNLPAAVTWFITVFSILWAALAEWSKRDTLRQQAEVEIAEFLRLVVDYIQTRLPRDACIRANIMVKSKNGSFLAIRWHVNMEVEAERRLLWAEGQGCVGTAWLKRGPVAEDLVRFQTASYDELLQDEGPVPYGLSREQWALTRHLGSVLSYPIPHPVRKTEILGILNLDSVLPLEKTRFRDDEELLRFLGDFAVPRFAQLMLRCQH